MPTGPQTRRPLSSASIRREQRPNANARGYGRRWQTYSKDYLARNPFCVSCSARGNVKASEATDHIQPITGPNDPHFWTPTNHQALCWTCHSRKTATENT